MDTKQKKKEQGKERESGKCALFIQKRGRYCRLSVARGSKYCGEHLNFDPELGAATSTSSPQRRRIPCPLDPHHTVYEHQLEVHLKKCNAAKKVTPVCYKANINTGIHNYQPSDEEKKPLSAFSQSQLDALIAKVEKIYQEHRCHIEELVLEHPAMNPDLSDPSNGTTALKHIRQQASILGHLEKLQLLEPHTCFVEFGAGRGKLTNCLQRARVHDDSVHYLLVDRANCRRKVDVYRRGDPSHEARVQRLLIDIEHLDLGKVDCLGRDDVRHVVAISKHLCGAATDLTLRCLLETMTLSHDHQQPMRLQNSSDVTLPHHGSPTRPPDAKRACTNHSSVPLCPPPSSPSCCPSPPFHKLRGIVIALCCHHRCTWATLVGTEWLRGCGLSPIDVHLVTKMTSWAVCGIRDPYDDHSPCNDSSASMGTNPSVTTDTGPARLSPTSPVTTTSYAHPNMTPTSYTHPNITTETSHTHYPPSYHPHPRESVGTMCKRLLDLARLHYLKQRGMEARLVYFVPRGTSLENVLLIATPSATTHT